MDGYRSLHLASQANWNQGFTPCFLRPPTLDCVCDNVELYATENGDCGKQQTGPRMTRNAFLRAFSGEAVADNEMLHSIYFNKSIDK